MPDAIIIIGANGSGKSLLLRSLVVGDDLPQIDFAREGVIDFGCTQNSSYLAQTLYRPIYSTRVDSLLATPLVLSGMSPRVAREFVGARLDQFGFRNLLNRTYYTLSGGERHIVQILACMQFRSDMLILDDPLSMIDDTRAQIVIDLIRVYVQMKLTHKVIIVQPNARRLLPAEGSVIHEIREPVRPTIPSATTFFSTLTKEVPYPPTDRHFVELKQLSLRFGEQYILQNVNATFTASKINIFVGPNGEGKSVLLQVVAGIHRPSIGNVSLSSTLGYESPAIGRNIMFLPQESELLCGPGRVDKYIHSGPDVPYWWSSAIRYLTDNHYLDLSLDMRAGSFGQRKFWTVLAALTFVAKSPSIKWLMLDEPDASLDTHLASIIANLIRICTSQLGLWVAIATHSPDLYESVVECARWRVDCQAVVREDYARYS